jgi:hypothetical protein
MCDALLRQISAYLYSTQRELADLWQACGAMNIGMTHLVTHLMRRWYSVAFYVSRAESTLEVSKETRRFESHDYIVVAWEAQRGGDNVSNQERMHFGYHLHREEWFDYVLRRQLGTLTCWLWLIRQIDRNVFALGTSKGICEMDISSPSLFDDQCLSPMTLSPGESSLSADNRLSIPRNMSQMNVGSLGAHQSSHESVSRAFKFKAKRKLPRLRKHTYYLLIMTLQHVLY